MTKSLIDSRVVFVVFGRNVAARDAMFTLLKSVGLTPVEWDEAVARTKSGSPFIGQILEKGLSSAQAVVVLMTGDDEAALRSAFHREDDPLHEVEFTPQVRPNVLFEAGMALGTHPNRTILVEFGRLRPFTDIEGRHRVRFDRSLEWRRKLLSRLKTAGCPVDLSKDVWRTAGDFQKAVSFAEASLGVSRKLTKLGHELATVGRALGTAAIKLLVVDKTPCTFDEAATYKLKLYVHVRNDTGSEILVRRPTSWIGKDLYRPSGAPEIPTSLQLSEPSGWMPRSGAPIEMVVPRGGIFRFWFGFDPKMRKEALEDLHKKNRVGRFTMPVELAGQTYAWTKNL